MAQCVFFFLLGWGYLRWNNEKAGGLRESGAGFGQLMRGWKNVQAARRLYQMWHPLSCIEYENPNGNTKLRTGSCSLVISVIYVKVRLYRYAMLL
ncbi:hypothetical protein BKA59DRAFT_8011 [Fusarium tricinctum]|uniref:Uncharacterized protein n=1 Tax=Fusarium tricinctum TaxID=61284 RepID=A0A8K0SC81_9HYPO|nr:hypothetical protein BKA59DRAFT_8011 [Fusarium tricinctum]